LVVIDRIHNVVGCIQLSIKLHRVIGYTSKVQTLPESLTGRICSSVKVSVPVRVTASSKGQDTSSIRVSITSLGTHCTSGQQLPDFEKRKLSIGLKASTKVTGTSIRRESWESGINLPSVGIQSHADNNFRRWDVVLGDGSQAPFALSLVDMRVQAIITWIAIDSTLPVS
jgi:hypothetical protein